MMKRTILHSTLFVFLISCLASCHSSSDLSSASIIQKRKYTKGFHVDLKSKRKNPIERVAAFEIEPPESPKEQKPVSRVDTEPVLTASVNENIPLKNVKTEKQHHPFNEKKTRESASSDISQRAAKPANSNQRNVSWWNNERSNVLTTPAAPSPAAAASGIALILLIVLTILIPPLGVAIVYGISKEFWISLLLTLLFYIPGLIYSLIKVLGA